MRIVNIHANALDVWLTANIPNTHVIPSKGNSIIVPFSSFLQMRKSTAMISLTIDLHWICYIAITVDRSLGYKCIIRIMQTDHCIYIYIPGKMVFRFSSVMVIPSLNHLLSHSLLKSSVESQGKHLSQHSPNSSVKIFPS